MQSEMSRIARRTACLGALALAALAGRGWPARAEAAADVDSVVADWPDDSRLAAKAMTEQYGNPRRSDADSLTWYGPGAWKRTVLHRSSADGNNIEQVAAYRVPGNKITELGSFDSRIQVNEKGDELSVRSESLATNFLLVNLAHEVVSGFKTVPEARFFYDKELSLSQAGKSSSYLSGLRFEPEQGATNAPWPESGTWSAPVGKPWDTRGTPWVVPPGAKLPRQNPLQP